MSLSFIVVNVLFFNSCIVLFSVHWIVIINSLHFNVCKYVCITLVQISMQINVFRFMRHVDRKVYFDLKRTCVKVFVKTLIFRGTSRASKFCIRMVNIPTAHSWPFGCSVYQRPFQIVNLLHPAGD